MEQELTTNQHADGTCGANISLTTLADEFERRLQAMYEKNWPGGNQPKVEATKASVIVHYGPPDHRMKMTRAEVLRFLDIIAEEASATGRK